MNNQDDPTRRQFLVTAAAAATVSAMRNVIAAPGTATASAPASGPAMSPATSSASAAVVSPATVPSRQRLQSFSYADVKLTAGPLKEQFDRAHACMMAIDENRMLKVYRQHAQLPADGPDMGGWYDATGFGPGHALGQWISALSRFGSATGDEATLSKVRRLVEGFAATLRADRPFYAAYRFPAYTFDKHLVGLLDAHRLAGVESALATVAKATDCALPVLPEKALTRAEMAHRPHKDVTFTWDEAYTLPENLFYAAELSGDSRYRDLARRFLHDVPYFDPLSRGENVLPGLHAYSHVNALSSAARAYLFLGDEKYLRAIKNAWDMIENTQQFASGGWGPKEEFVEPGKGRLGESLKQTHNHFETPCGAYAHFKLARYLLRITGESRYGDNLERVLYNTILAAKELKPDGSTFYYSDYHPLTAKRYNENKWPCCAGTYPQAVADYLLNIYFHSGDAIYVNLFVPSELRCMLKDAAVTLTQTTDYPDAGKVSVRIKVDRPAEFSLFIRVPAWINEPPRFTVNGAPVPVDATPRDFAEIRRRWQDNDHLEFDLPMKYRVEPVDAQNPRTVALLRGPVMMVATDPDLSLSKAAVDAVNADTSNSMTAAPDPAALHATARARFVPFHKIKDEIYTTYFTLE